MPPDPKPPPRYRDRDLLAGLHAIWRTCVVCGGMGETLHHVNKHPRDDVKGNLVMVCGDGTRGCHGRLEAHDPAAKASLWRHVQAHRPDVIRYCAWRRGEAWLETTLLHSKR